MLFGLFAKKLLSVLSNFVVIMSFGLCKSCVGAFCSLFKKDWSFTLGFLSLCTCTDFVEIFPSWHLIEVHVFGVVNSTIIYGPLN